MAINFDALPDKSPNMLQAKGTYFATIESAEMKQGKDPAKPPYLNLKFGLKDAMGKSAGKLYDIMAESEHNIVRYKLQRFIKALELPITGEFELADLAKIVTGKKLILDLTIDEKSDPHKNVVDVFSGAIFYPVAEAHTLFPCYAVEDTGINAPDAEDAKDDTDY